MNASFRAYVDESGDEGFGFRSKPGQQGSSDWFVLAALVTRMKTDIQTVKLIDEVRREFTLHPRKHVHWKKLKHHRKVRYAQMLAELPARVVSVCVHKPSLLEPEKFHERYRLYFYAVRYLLERLSWLVRDSHNPAKYCGDGTAHVLFSNRQGMSYKEMREYLQLLHRQKGAGQDIRIEFDLVPIDQIEAQTPDKSMGLQLADAVAGAIFNGLERDSYGNTEPRYVQTLSHVFYRRRGILLGYGLKIVPRETTNWLTTHASLKWLTSLE